MRAVFRRPSLLVLALASLVACACASKLPRQKTSKTPVSTAEPIDLAAITFTDLRTGEAVNLRAYMDESGRDFLLLTFGSKGCGSCNRKSRQLTEQVIGKHPLFLTPSGQRFEIVGVNTDPDPSRLGVYLTQFPYIQWSDPSGKLMLRFMPEGRTFGVPLTVMLSRRGIEWRVLPDEPMALESMMAKVEYTLGLRAEVPGQDGGGPDDGGDGRTDGGDGDDGMDDGVDDGGSDDGGADGDGIAATSLDAQAPGRLKRVQVTSCTGEPMSLHTVLGLPTYRFVQVTQGACDATCQANQTALHAIQSSCTARGATCAAASLVSSLDQAACASGTAYQGGGEFFRSFAHHFDWTYPRAIADTGLPMMTRGVEGPLVLGFNLAGDLVFSHEGRLHEGQLEAAMTAAGFGAKALPGPNFPVYTPETGTVGFAEFRQRAKYTVLAAFGYSCFPCIEELKHWSQPGDLIDFCATSGGECQVIATEIGEPYGETLADYYRGLKFGRDDFDGFAALGIRAPLVLDPLSMSTDEEMAARFFNGYLVAVGPEDWWQDPRAIIFDREGRILKQFLSEEREPGEIEPVFPYVRKLLGR